MKRVLWRTRWHDSRRHSWRIRWEFDPRDIWVGLYWDRKDTSYAVHTVVYDVYLIVVPMLPLHVQLMNVYPDD